ncbi:predicted protein [Botrytis cinerea T4]|uniref:Uncharacterized protein n=1 Tax=Botryotinia fuckeliana (strain T4) TaxID=999810 RepID=G2YRM6_BOTF4|nr:predicted protein [Botrytis cinerea T4]
MSEHYSIWSLNPRDPRLDAVPSGTSSLLSELTLLHVENNSVPVVQQAVGYTLNGKLSRRTTRVHLTYHSRLAFLGAFGGVASYPKAILGFQLNDRGLTLFSQTSLDFHNVG